uniref:Uncharacterized protein n=1 Tax=Oryza glumipatula TaxID=40148 RepID=A0A0D9YBE8_9ORYZ
MAVVGNGDCRIRELGTILCKGITTKTWVADEILDPVGKMQNKLRTIQQEGSNFRLGLPSKD